MWDTPKKNNLFIPSLCICDAPLYLMMPWWWWWPTWSIYPSTRYTLPDTYLTVYKYIYIWWFIYTCWFWWASRFFESFYLRPISVDAQITHTHTHTLDASSTKNPFGRLNTRMCAAHVMEGRVVYVFCLRMCLHVAKEQPTYTDLIPAYVRCAGTTAVYLRNSLKTLR